MEGCCALLHWFRRRALPLANSPAPPAPPPQDVVYGMGRIDALRPHRLLMRFLLRQEISRYQEAVPTGLAADLELASLLVAEQRQVDDVWLH